jgi:hypothetical protein
MPRPAAVEPQPKSDVQDVAAVTITGCLELDEDTGTRTDRRSSHSTS